MTERRGKTFSPAHCWFDGGPSFAFEKLAEVRSYLLELSEKEEERRRVRWQQVYDLRDAATTISDAIHYIDPGGTLRQEKAVPPIFAALSESELTESRGFVEEDSP